MRVTIFSVLGVTLTTLAVACHGRALDSDASSSHHSDLLPRQDNTTAAPAATIEAPVCRRDFMIRDDYTVLRQSTRNILVKRVEKNIPGT